MKASTYVTVLLLFSATETESSDWSLLGTWQSNASLTIESIESVGELSPEGRAASGRMFGKMTLTFSEDSVEVDLGVLGAENFSRPYRVVESTSEKITIEYGSPGDPEDTADYFLEDSCMKRKQPSQDFYEYWCKVE